MKKLTISIIALTLACPSFANIGKNESSPTCDDATIGATSGSTDLEAQWTANTINLDWYSDGEKILTSSCTYDGGITLPSTPTVPTGYTFGGWRLRAAAASAQCSLTGYDLSLNGNNYAGHGFANNNDYCYAGRSAGGAQVCTTDELNGLLVNEWKAVFEYGTIKGTSLCSAQNGDNHFSFWDAPETDWLSDDQTLGATNSGTYCWCKITSFLPTNDETKILQSNTWVLAEDTFSTEAKCLQGCSRACASWLVTSEYFRNVMYDSACNN